MKNIGVCGQKFLISVFISVGEKAQEVGWDAEKGNPNTFSKLTESSLEVPS